MADNFQQASKKAQHQAKVDSLNTMGEPLDSFVQREGMIVFEKPLGDFIERVTDNINAEPNMVTTGAITDLTIEAKDGMVVVMGSPHLVFQSRGVNGSILKLYDTPHSYQDKRPPVEAFKNYIKNKGIIYSENNDKKRAIDDRLTPAEQTADRPFKELTDDQKINKAAWAMSTKVFREGFRGKDLYEKEIPQLVDDCAEILADFSIQNIFQDIPIQPRGGGGNRIIIK